MHKIAKDKQARSSREFLTALAKIDFEDYQVILLKDILQKTTVAITFKISYSDRSVYRKSKKARKKLVEEIGIRKFEELSGVKIRK